MKFHKTELRGIDLKTCRYRPGEDDVTELSKDELDPERELAVEEIPGEEEAVAMEG